MNVVRWMLLGFIIAGPSLSILHSQDSRSARLADKNQPTTSLQLRSSKTPEPSARALDPGKASAPSRSEIVLPDIYIAVPNDTIATLKQQLEQAEQDLQQLQYEHRRLEKTLEQIQQRSFQGTRPPVQRTTGLRGRPSV